MLLFLQEEANTINEQEDIKRQNENSAYIEGAFRETIGYFNLKVLDIQAGDINFILLAI